MKKSVEPTINDVANTLTDLVGVIHAFSTEVDRRFEAIDKRFDDVDKRFDDVDKRFDDIDTEMKRMKAVMVTKDYLDDKLANLHSDIIQQTRKECKTRLQSAGLKI